VSRLISLGRNCPPGRCQPNYAPISVNEPTFREQRKHTRRIYPLNELTLAPPLISATATPPGADGQPQHQHHLGALVACVGFLLQPSPKLGASLFLIGFQFLELFGHGEGFLQHRPDIKLSGLTFLGFKVAKSRQNKELLPSKTA
jgi:hypothetical protein